MYYNAQLRITSISLGEMKAFSTDLIMMSPHSGQSAAIRSSSAAYTRTEFQGAIQLAAHISEGHTWAITQQGFYPYRDLVGLRQV